MTHEDDAPAAPLDLSAMDEVRPGAWMAPGNQIVVNDRLIAGRGFAHRITERELVAGWLEVDPDFTALAAFTRAYTTADGAEIAIVDPGTDDRVPATTPGPVLVGPDGWLDGGWADAFAVLTAEGDAISLRWEDRPEPASIDAATVLGVFEGLGGAAPAPLLDVVLHLLVNAPELFTDQTPPVRDLLAAAGLVATGGFVRRASDVDAGPTRPRSLPGLRLDSSRAAQLLLQSIVSGPQPGDATDDAVLAALADADAVSAMAEQIVGAELVPAAEVRAWLDGLDVPDVGATLAGVTFLRSRLAEWEGDVGAEESALMASIHLSEQPAALVDAAWFASDRGDARQAQALLRAAGVPPDDPEVQLLHSFTIAGPLLVGRNEPCWCGSGRKHKHCCLRLNGHGLATRTRWLQAKAVTFLQRPPQRATMLQIAAAYAGVDSPEAAPDRVVAAACDATVSELCLFEAGVFDRFVEQRGRLLPDDELELARSWVDARHALLEIVEGEGAVRDPSTGDTRSLDVASAKKLPASGSILAVLRPGPVALPGPVLSVTPALVDEIASLVAGHDAVALATRIGSEFGWTAAPALSFAPSRGAGEAASVR